MALWNAPAAVPHTGKNKLLRTLNRVNKHPIELTSGDGQSLVVLPYGGRILGLYSSESSDNFLWTHPALSDGRSAREFYESSAWHNSGGDRTWLSPELDYFFPNYPDTSLYVQPRQLDATLFGSTASSAEVTLGTAFTLQSYRKNVELALNLKKTISFIDDPLVKQYSFEISGLEFAGYRLHTRLRAEVGLPSDTAVGIWNLLQLPSGGELLVPTYVLTHPTVFFGIIPNTDLRVDERVIRFRMQANGEQKLCVQAIATTGRVGYVYSRANRFVLIVRSFAVDPCGDYVDVWSTKPDDDGYAVQACNINTPSLGRFAELEYHAPAITGNSGRLQSDDISVVWAYRGRREAICRAAHILLGTEL